MDDVDHGHAKPRASDPIVSTGLPALGLSALGVVFGDIGTSPLYTLKTVLTLIGGASTPDHVLGVLSLILWTLVIITTIKYVTVAMSIDNDGEGGVLALMALLGVKRHQRPAIVAGQLPHSSGRQPVHRHVEFFRHPDRKQPRHPQGAPLPVAIGSNADREPRRVPG